MNETETKIVEYLAESLKKLDDAIECDKSINCEGDIIKYYVLKMAINAIIKDINTGEYKK